MILSSSCALFNLYVFLPGYLHFKGKFLQLEDPVSFCLLVSHSLVVLVKRACRCDSLHLSKHSLSVTLD